MNAALNEGLSIHEHHLKSGVDPYAHFWISLLNFSAKCGFPTFARQMLVQMPEQHVPSWTALIQGFRAQGNGWNRKQVQNAVLWNILINGHVYVGSEKRDF